MSRIEFEIKLNESGRPCIDLPEDYENKPEDRFFSIEIARYILQDIYARRSAEFDADASKSIENGITLLGQIGDEIAQILWNDMKTMGEVAMILDSAYHVEVHSIEERDNLSFDYFAYNGKLYKRQEGLKVYVMQPLEQFDRAISGLYKLVGGITNENWVKIS